MNEQIMILQNQMKEILDENRFQHTLGVMYTAGCLAMRYECDLDQALTAGVLHDCAKCIPVDQRKRLCQKYQISLTNVEQNNPSLLHAKLGAKIAEEQYHISDQAILDAIKYHTTGRPGMSLLEKIIYIADYIEPGRKELPDMKKVRQLAFCDLDQCLSVLLEDAVTYLKSRNKPIDPLTEETCQYYQKKEKETWK